jgi:hypothetical protein
MGDLNKVAFYFQRRRFTVTIARAYQRSRVEQIRKLTAMLRQLGTIRG